MSTLKGWCFVYINMVLWGPIKIFDTCSLPAAKFSKCIEQVLNGFTL